MTSCLGSPGNVGKFDGCHRNVAKLTRSEGSVEEESREGTLNRCGVSLLDEVVSMLIAAQGDYLSGKPGYVAE